MIEFEFPKDNIKINLMRYMSHTGGDFYSQIFCYGDPLAINHPEKGGLHLESYIKTNMSEGKPVTTICRNNSYPYGIDKDVLNFACRKLVDSCEIKNVRTFDKIFTDSIRLNIIKKLYEKAPGKIPGSQNVEDYSESLLQTQTTFWFALLNASSNQDGVEAILKYLPENSNYDVNFYSLRIKSIEEFRLFLFDCWVKNHTKDFKWLTISSLSQMYCLDKYSDCHEHIVDDPFLSMWNKKYENFPEWFDVKKTDKMLSSYNYNRIKELKDLMKEHIIDDESQKWIDHLSDRFANNRDKLLRDGHRHFIFNEDF